MYDSNSIKGTSHLTRTTNTQGGFRSVMPRLSVDLQTLKRKRSVMRHAQSLSNMPATLKGTLTIDESANVYKNID